MRTGARSPPRRPRTPRAAAAARPANGAAPHYHRRSVSCDPPPSPLLRPPQVEHAPCYGSERTLYPRRSALDGDAVPEGDVVLDLRRRRLRRRIIPRRVGVLCPVHNHRVVMRRALPRADRGGGARLEEAPVERAGREIDIALDQLKALALRQHLALPCRLGHPRLPLDLAAPGNICARPAAH